MIYGSLTKAQAEMIIGYLYSWADGADVPNKKTGICGNIKIVAERAKFNGVSWLVYELGVGMPCTLLEEDGCTLTAFPLGHKKYSEQLANDILWQDKQRLLLCKYIAVKLEALVCASE